MAFGKKTSDPERSRNGERQTVAIQATARLGCGEPSPIEILDLSASGLRAAIARPVTEGMLLRIALPIGRSPHARVVWYDGEQMGCAFLAEIDVSDLADLIAVLPVPVPALA